MPLSTLILDKSNPDIAELISEWADGESYRLSGMDIVQRSSDDTKAVFDVVGVEVQEVEDIEPAPAPAAAQVINATPKTV